MSNFFISYSHDGKESSRLAEWLHGQLTRQGHEAFIYKKDIAAGQRWSERISELLPKSDLFILLLSEQSSRSDFITEEVNRAYSLNCQHKRPVIITVRVIFDGDPGYHLGAMLNPYQWLSWNESKDSRTILKQILQSAADPSKQPAGKAPRPKASPKRSRITALPPPMASPIPGTARQRANLYYIERGVEKPLLAEAALFGNTVTIEAPRQIGKSSLLQRYLTAAQAAGQRVALVDFSLFNEFHFARFEDLMRQIADKISGELGIEQTSAQDVGDSVKFTNWIKEQILPAIADPVLLAFDEADAVFDYDYRRDFFKMLRSWWNLRWRDEKWERLGLAMVISTERNLLVDKATISPFNIGEHVRLQPFTSDECRQFNERFQQFTGRSLDDGQVRQLWEFLGGQPYLTHTALKAVILDRLLTPDDLVETADEDDGLFADHLRALLARLLKRPDYRLAETFREILDGNPVADRLAAGRLKAAGLAREHRRAFLPANQLYARFFRRML
jgi:hypothetical protein